MEEKLFDSFEIRNEYGKLTNAGALLADDAPIKQSRLFCTCLLYTSLCHQDNRRFPVLQAKADF